ncbi:MAG: prenyltransferase/squalene oxidase repeat-containing protein [Planctomycetota bacterium]
MKRLVLALVMIGFTLALPAQRQREQSSSEWAITPELQEAVGHGLQWLAEQQHPQGFWTQDVGFKLNTDYRVTSYTSAHVGVTSLALMSFLAGGHLPGRGRYGNHIERGLDYVLSCVRENGYITDHGSRMYSHAFATLLLAEAYGMTLRSDVRQALQRSVNLIVDSQNAEGGWRYRPFARESDMSITVCQVLALRSARNVGITVPAGTIEAAQQYVRLSAVTDYGPRRRSYHFPGYLDEGGAFRYQLGRHSRATFPLTAAGVTTLYAAGIYDDETINRALEYMSGKLGDFNNHYEGHYFFYYGHYYAVQAFYIAGGIVWRSYFQTIRRTLLDMQKASGAWPCHVGPGDAFATAVATLILQIPYQYLPIFQR